MNNRQLAGVAFDLGEKDLRFGREAAVCFWRLVILGKKGRAVKKWIGFAILAVCANVSASPGGVDKFGCHTSKTDGYHCHKQKIERIVASVKGETQYQRSLRLAAQCKNMPNEGVCFGYVNQSK